MFKPCLKTITNKARGALLLWPCPFFFFFTLSLNFYFALAFDFPPAGGEIFCNSFWTSSGDILP